MKYPYDKQYAYLDALGMAAVVLDRRLMVEFMNAKAKDLLGVKSSELIGKLVDQLLPPGAGAIAAGAPDLVQQIVSVVIDQTIELQTVLARTDNSVFFSRVIISPVEGRDGIAGYCLLLEDITVAQNNARDLALSAQVFQHSGEPIMITDRLDRILKVNAAFTRLIGYEESAVLGRTPGFLREGLGEDAIYKKMWEELAKHGQWSGEVFNRKKCGELLPSWLSITKIEDGPISGHYISIFSDISSHQHELKNFRHLAHHDFLTGLPNRALFLDRFEQAATRQKRRQEQVMAVLFIDLDGFKQINDRLGHGVGDQLLIDVAQAFKRRLREEDTVCRFGGDEFIVLLTDLRPGLEPLAIADKLLKSVEALPQRPGADKISASIGIALYPSHGHDAETLIALADKAMYAAKSSGKARSQLWGE